MKVGVKLEGPLNGYVYSAQFRSERPASDYTARIIPSNSDVLVPLGANTIVWYRH
jgi:glycogen phosphorylase